MKLFFSRRCVVTLAIALTIFIASTVGGSIAWFTDSVTSSSNIIKSGTLDVEMYWADGKADPAAEATVWKDASIGAIFDYSNWEPGYTDVRHIRIKNAGSLAFKYQLDIVADGEVSDLAKAIDVYFADPAAQVSSREVLVSQTPIGTLDSILAGMPESTSGQLLAGDQVDVTLALKMQESAGNEYQGLSIGSDFAVQLLATQLPHEEDSFDNQYDADSKMAITISGETSISSIVGGMYDDVALIGEGIDKSKLVSEDGDKIVADNLMISDMTIDADHRNGSLIIEGDNALVKNVSVDLIAETEDGTPSDTSFNGLILSGSNITVKDATIVGGEGSALMFQDGSDTADSVTTVENCKFPACYRDVYFAGAWLKMPVGGGGIRFLNSNGTINISNVEIETIRDKSALRLGSGNSIARGKANITSSVIRSASIEIQPIISISFNDVSMGDIREENKMTIKINAQQASFTDCNFTSAVAFQNTSYPITFTNCTFGEDKTKITSSNYEQLGISFTNTSNLSFN